MATNDKKKGINTNSNAYTIIYAVVMVVIVAFLLAFVSSSLKETQDANVLRDTKNQILLSLNIEGLKGQQVDEKYDAVITDTLKCGEQEYYKAVVNDSVKFVFPVKGRGLWGGLWGYISVDEDKQHTYGAYFGHESETAGLGARINERWFQKQFCGAPIMDAEGNIALTVVKAGAKVADTDIDGVTGATLTSKGVAAMVNEGLNSFGDIIKVQACAAGPECGADMPCCGGEKKCCGEEAKCEGDSCVCPEVDGVCPMKAEGKCCKDSANVEQAK